WRAGPARQTPHGAVPRLRRRAVQRRISPQARSATRPGTCPVHDSEWQRSNVVYICIPAYNEARTIGVLLWKIRQVMAEFNRDYQLLVVDDASTDATPSVLEPYQRVLPLTVIRHAERRGYAASLEELLREAVRRSSYPRRDVIVTLQADFTEEPAEIPSFVKRIEGGADVVSSAARFEDSKAPRVVHWARRVLGFLVRRLRMPGTESDPFSGFRAYRVVCVKKALEGRGGAPILMRQGWA